MRQIIIIGNKVTDLNTMHVDYVYWLSAPQGALVSIPGFVSQAPGTTAAEMSALQSGSVVERVLASDVPLGWSAATIGQYLVERYQPLVNYYASVGSIKNYTNTSYNGTTWINVPT